MCSSTCSHVSDRFHGPWERAASGMHYVHRSALHQRSERCTDPSLHRLKIGNSVVSVTSTAWSYTAPYVLDQADTLAETGLCCPFRCLGMPDLGMMLAGQWVIFFTLFFALLLKVGALPPTAAVGWTLISIQLSVILLGILFIGFDFATERKYIEKRYKEVKHDVVERLKRKQKADANWETLKLVIKVQARARAIIARRRMDELRISQGPKARRSTMGLRNFQEKNKGSNSSRVSDDLDLANMEMMETGEAGGALNRDGTPKRRSSWKDATVPEPFQVGQNRSDGGWKDRGVRGVPRKTSPRTTTPEPFGIRASFRDLEGIDPTRGPNYRPGSPKNVGSTL